MSRELQELLELKRMRPEPENSSPGDMWVNKRLGIVMVALGVKRKRGIKHTGQHFVFLYHCGKESLNYARSDWDENDTGLTCDSIRRDRIKERWVYRGNIFDKLPYEAFGGPWRGPNLD